MVKFVTKRGPCQPQTGTCQTVIQVYAPTSNSKEVEVDWFYEDLQDLLAAKSLQSCPTLCNPRDGSPPGSCVPGVLQARTHWSGLPFPSSMHESEKSKEVAQLCPTLGNPMDCSLPGSSVHGIFQARVLEWGATAFSELLILPQTKFACL